jgi:hypothetical protein
MAVGNKMAPKDQARTSETHRPDDRASRFIARVAHLPTLADDGERRAFLDRQLDGWEHRYACFIATDGASEFAGNACRPSAMRRAARPMMVSRKSAACGGST